MKRAIYLVVITTITIGCVIYGAYNFSNGGPLFSFGIGDSNKIEKSVTLEAFERIHVDADVLDFTVKEGATYALDYKGSENMVLSYRVDNGELVISQKKKNTIIGNHGAELVLTVPKDVIFEKVDVGIDVGNVDISELTVQHFDADIDIGDVTVAKSSLEQVIIESDTGNIALEACDFEKLDISADIGDVKVDSSVDISSYAYDLKADVGEVEVNASDYGRKFQKEGQAGKITIRADVGNIKVND